MEPEVKDVVVILTVGKADNGKNATLGFSCALSALAMGHRAAVFLTSDGAVWGYQGSSSGITVQGFPPLEDIIHQFLDSGGRLILCSVCHRTCSSGSPELPMMVERLPQTEIGGFATMLEMAMGGIAVTF
ncbi:MAG: DsrE family protein [Planctomycetales bacterium]|nr:DsrE family protein [Planctomycetales bacterium]